MIQPQSNRRKRVAEEVALVVRPARRAPEPPRSVAGPVNGGMYDLDCSAFVSYVLRETTPEHYARIPKEAHQPCPGALEFAAYFESLTYDEVNGWRRRCEIDDALVFESSQGWRRVERLGDVRRGDVIAWRFAHAAPGADTGHVLLVADKSAPAGSGVIAVRVFGSTRPPGLEDSQVPRDSFETGMGIRTLLFQVSRSGAPSAVQFAPSDRFHALPIVIGRLEPLAL
jgi:hypothetical protein